MFFSRWKNRIEQSAYQQGFSDGQNLAQKETFDRREEYEHNKLKLQVGSPVIRIPNEWDNPVIGFGHRVEMMGNSPMLVVHDYVRNRQTVGGGVCFDFSEQKLDVLLRLDPFEAWAFLAHNSVGHDNFDKIRTGQRDSAEEIIEKLHLNGFFERWEKFKHEQR